MTANDILLMLLLILAQVIMWSVIGLNIYIFLALIKLIWEKFRPKGKP